MDKIANFDKLNLQLLRAEMNKALAEVEKSFGVKFDIGNIGFNEASFKAQLTAVLASKVDNPYLENVSATVINNLVKYAEYKNSLGRTVTFRGTKFVIIGLKGNNFLAKKEGQPSGPIYKLAHTLGDELDRQVKGSK